MSKYKVGDKIVVEIEKAALTDNGGEFYTGLGYVQSVISIDEKSEPLSTYTEQARAEGQNEAWELARKIASTAGGLSSSELVEIFNAFLPRDILSENTYQEAAAKVAQWEKAKEEIKVGDVVSHEEKYGVVISEGTICFRGFTDDGTPFEWYKERCTKTGRHIDIDSFLKQIGGGE